MNLFTKLLLPAAVALTATAAHADRKEDVFYLLMDNAADNPVLQQRLRTSLIDLMITDALSRGLGLADSVLLRAERTISSWNSDILTSRSVSPDQLGDTLLDRLPESPDNASSSRLMRLLQTTPIDCSIADTVTVYVFTNLVSSISLNADGAHLETAPSVSLAGCNLVWVGPTLGSPELGLREVQHIDALLANLSAYIGVEEHVILR